jgi:hypothetical protein
MPATRPPAAIACAEPSSVSGTSPRPEYRPCLVIGVSPCRTRISRVALSSDGGAQDRAGASASSATETSGAREAEEPEEPEREEPEPEPEPEEDELPERASSIARFASASAALLRSRGIHSKVTWSNRLTRVAASAASGRSPGCLICQRPDICSITSFESIRTSTCVAFSSRAAFSPSIRPVYSATLLVVMPSDPYRSSKISPVGWARTTAP